MLRRRQQREPIIAGIIAGGWALRNANVPRPFFGLGCCQRPPFAGLPLRRQSCWSSNSLGHADKSHCRRMRRCLVSGGIETIAGWCRRSFRSGIAYRPNVGFGSNCDLQRPLDHRRLSARNATFGGECPECAGKRTFVCSSAKVSYVEGFRMRAAARRQRLVGTTARVGKPPKEESAGRCRGVSMGKAGWCGRCSGAAARSRGGADEIGRVSCGRFRG